MSKDNQGAAEGVNNPDWNPKDNTGHSPIEPDTPLQPERFKMPTDDQVVKMALIFNDGRLDPKELTNMVSMCQFVIDRLYENGDILIPSSKEK